MKAVHKALKLRHHKHTGKILAHKHTSYRVLFLLLLAPILMMSLVDRLDAAATDYVVSATVPAPIPAGSPTIDSPKNNLTTQAEQITVSGTCPVINPAIIIAVYDNGNLVGSGQCSPTGGYSIPVSLSIGTHSLVVTIVTITGGVGGSSAAVTVTRIVPPTVTTPSQEKISSVDLLALPLRIIPKDVYVIIDSDGRVTWKGSFEGGVQPYVVKLDWGDGRIDQHTITDSSEQVFSHDYDDIRTYGMGISAKDSHGNETRLQSIALTLLQKQTISMDQNTPMGVPPIFAYIERHIVSIYIGVLSAVIFLWYLEHGRHVLTVGRILRQFGHMRKRW